MQNDERFKKALNDPRFKIIPKAQTKVKIDKRFSRMFTDKNFTAPVSVDKYGRPLAPKVGDDMKRFYHLEEEEEEKEEEEEEKEEEEEEEANELNESDLSHDDPSADDLAVSVSNSDAEISSADEELSSDEISIPLKKQQKKLGLVVRRQGPAIGGIQPPSNIIYGEGLVSSDSDSETNSSDLEALSVSEESEHSEPELGDATPRLAIMNCDWEKIRAVDLFVLLSSFVPNTGLLHSVTIYPSDFGLKRMQEEITMGPPKEIFKKTEVARQADELGELEEIDTPSVSSDEEGSGSEAEAGPVPEGDEEGQEPSWQEDYSEAFDPVSLRKYELEKLKYYYAVAVFDSAETANVAYDNVDHFEFERSSNVIDCRFVPEGTEFTNPPRETCTHVPPTYKAPRWSTKVLQHTKIELGWDKTDPHRQEITRKAFETDEIQEDDWKAYMASSSSSSDASGSSSASSSSQEEEEEAKATKEARQAAKRQAIRDKYRSLLDEALSINASDRSSENFAHGDQSDESVEGDLEITFTTGLAEAAEELLEKKKQREEDASKGFWEKTVEKKSQKRKDRARERAELQEQLEKEQRDTIKKAKQQSKLKRRQKRLGLEPVAGSSEEERPLDPALMLMGAPRTKATEVEDQPLQATQHHKKHQRSRRDEIKTDDKIEIDTTRFGALLTDPSFAPDPSHPQYRDTVAMKKIRSSRLQLSEANATQPAASSSQFSSQPQSQSSVADMKLLVDSVKRRVASSSSVIPLPHHHQHQQQQQQHHHHHHHEKDNHDDDDDDVSSKRSTQFERKRNIISKKLDHQNLKKKRRF